MRTIKSIGVFCGSNLGSHKAFQQAAEQFVITLAENNIRLVYGGTSVGLMRILGLTSY